MNTYWNGERCEARQVRVIVADSEAPLYWARHLIGQEREAVEVIYNGETFYLDDQESPRGWNKVTGGHGSPAYGHRDLQIERVVGTNQ